MITLTRPGHGCWPLAFALLSLLGCAGEEPSPDAAPAAESHAEVVTLWSAHLELFMEYPPLVAGQRSEPWAVHLTRLDGFQPVMEGRLELVFSGPDGSEHRALAEAPTRPGIYGPEVELPAAGNYDLVIRYAGPGLSDELWVGPVHVFASVEALPSEGPEPETGIVFLKEQQWVTPFGSAEVATRAVAEALEAPGEVIPADGGMVRVDAPLAGLLTPAANRGAPSVGARVRRGDILAVLTSAAGEDSWAALVARVEHLAREVQRLEPLHAAGAVPARRLEVARHDWTAARRSLEALGAPGDSGARLTVRAPIDGVIAERQMVVGTRVGEGDPLFTVVVPESVWIRFRVPLADADRLSRVTGATFRVAGDTMLHRTGAPVARAPVVDQDTRSLSLMLAPNGAGTLRVGTLVQGHLLGRSGTPGLAIPNQAIRVEDGVPVSYVQVAGELFQRRVVVLGASDGSWTEVRSGVEPGERVVVQGAYQVRLASLNPASVSDHGHPH